MKSVLTFAFAATTVLATCTLGMASAHAQTDSDRCPVGYWLMERLCMHEESGDVIVAAPPREVVVAPIPGCAPGYWRQDHLCHNTMTGDVELADDSRSEKGTGASLSQVPMR